ncbi:MAG: hypothetical protein G3M78_13095 [Candidatus Nitrohelix vancouverensis]|uniref:Uncharacterized protein n=1 Tax=Candidatus Nitrohelix vancouverensis TaxID=2705534 RepID=A0A7T0C4F3_9BACT|nr:MAG: hypothetical protein G3M78_13095 [Candidatus Nitrohelix vancouverensis]
MTVESIKVNRKILDREGRLNLYYLHKLYGHIAQTVSRRLFEEHFIDIPMTAGMWGGSYMVANDEGIARSNVTRLYSIVNVPQNSRLDDPKNFELLMITYHQVLKETLDAYGFNFVDPQWGEKIPYTNNLKPTTSLQMWDQSKRVHYLRVFFVWNITSWEESIIYDAVRKIKVVKEVLDLNRPPMIKDMAETKFLLQDTLILYYTLYGALTEDFKEHADAIMQPLLKEFLGGIRSAEVAEEWFLKIYSNAIVYGFEEALEGAYQKYGLEIKKVEEWPVDKINWVPPELKEKLVPQFQKLFLKFQTNLEKKYLDENAD